MKRMSNTLKARMKQAVNGTTYPNLSNWQPLTAQEKFHSFLHHTYSPATFAGAGVDALKRDFRDHNHEYEMGMEGLGQRYGIQLATGESDVFFERFLMPTLLKQDARYFRNPDLPFIQRATYSISRVFITRGDNGRETWNASKVLGGAISQALSDLYVPGLKQGIGPIVGRVSFNLVRDAGFNLIHEFWPDLRRKIFHRDAIW